MSCNRQVDSVSTMDEECVNIETFRIEKEEVSTMAAVSATMEQTQSRKTTFSKAFLCVAAVAILLPTILMAVSSNTQLSSHEYSLNSRRSRRHLQNETDSDSIHSEATAGSENENSTSPILFLNGTDRTEPLNNQNNNQTSPPRDELPTIEVTLPAGVTATDENVADVIAEQIDETTNAIETDSPTKTPTRSPTNRPIEDGSPTTSPTISFEPTQTPTSSPQPTISMAPTKSPAPSSHPTISPSDSPTLHPTQTFEPSASPSSSPTISPQPSVSPSLAPSDLPTRSQSPSTSPTVSFRPTISSAPSTDPTNIPTVSPTPAPTPVATEVAIKRNNLMVLSNVPFPLQNSTYSIWENVTSQHLVNYFQKFSKTFTQEFFFEIVNVETEFIGQRILEGEILQDGKASTAASSRKDQPIEKPPFAPVELPNTLTIEIAYNQWVVYETDEVTMSKDELFNRLFVLPFTTDSFHYSMDLYNSKLNWTTWVFVDTVDPLPPPTAPPAPPTRVASGLTSVQTFAISASTIVAACLIVFALLKERTQKGRGDESVSVESGMPHAMRGTSPQSPWNNELYPPRIEDSSVTVEDTAYDSVRSSRTASGHRRNTVERGIHRREPSFDDRRSNNAKFGTYRSVSSNNSSNPESNKHGLSPRHSPRNDSYGSPGIPRHVSGSSNRNSVRTDKTDRPFLPPLPPPSAYGSALTPERPRSMLQPLEAGPTRDYHNNNNNNNNTTNHNRFARPSGRAAFGMRLSGIANDDMTEISILTDPFSSEHRRQSNDYANPNPQVEASTDSQRSRPEAFVSPLHIPDEESMNRAPMDNLLSPTPESPVPNILGLASRSMNDPLTPTRTGFAMFVQDIEDDLER